MENLNAEQIIKALERCLEDVANCNNCPYERYCDMHENNMLRDTLALINSQEQRIKELTDNLHASCTELTRVQEENERLMREKTALECVVSTARNQAKADTVRKMQERLKEHLEKPEFPWDSFTVAEEVIDQIAKEMLEGDDG